MTGGFRSVSAIVEPQDAISSCLRAASGTLQLDPAEQQGTGISGLMLDHYGFVVSRYDYGVLQPGFAATYPGSFEVYPSALALATVADQRGVSEALSWHDDHPFPAVALMVDPSLGIKYGGGYMAVLVPSLVTGQALFDSAGLKYLQSELFGQLCLRADLGTTDAGVGHDTYMLFAVTAPLLESARALK